MNNITKRPLESFPNTVHVNTIKYMYMRTWKDRTFLWLTWNPFANTLTIDALTDCFSHYQGESNTFSGYLIASL